MTVEELRAKFPDLKFKHKLFSEKQVVARNNYDSVEDMDCMADELAYSLNVKDKSITVVIQEEYMMSENSYTSCVLSEKHIPELERMLADLKTITEDGEK